MSKKNSISDQQLLFDAEEMGRITPGDLWEERDEPVTCLGQKFPNEEARREFFREELRKKLPELRKIEGFPIGTDDDIINLSDPPYYTACPNPWLNDFINQWEGEKKQLEDEGKRKADFKVKEPYASDVSEGKNNPVYTAHTYHTKVPHPAVMRYILQYTQPGDIVLDGFAGTGMTGVAAAACSNDKDAIAARINGEWEKQYGNKPIWGTRHAIIGDLSPYATNIAYFYNTPINVNQLKQEVSRIQREMEEECGWMYTTTNSKGEPIGKIDFVLWSDIMVCPSCGKEYVFWHQAVDQNRKCILDDFNCPHCHAMQSKKTAKLALETYYDEVLKSSLTRVKMTPVIIVAKAGKESIQRQPTEYDSAVLRRINEIKVDTFYPSSPLPKGRETQRNVDRGITNVHQFYTKRNLIALSKLYNKIEKSNMPHILRFIFTGMINRSSNMNRIHINHFFNGGGGWNGGNLKGTLYIPSLPIETSILEQIDDKLSAMLRAEEKLAKVRPNVQYVGSADRLSIKDNSIDYIFTDPPFGANINYSELNSLPEPWLRVVTNNSREAIENTAQGKDAHSYRDIMSQCFSEYNRVLKPGKWMTVEFSNTSASVWNSIQSALQYAGFVIANVSSLDKKQGSFMAVTTTTAVKQDLVITCYKPSDELSSQFNLQMDRKDVVWDFVQEHLEHLAVHIEKGSKTTTVIERSPKILYDRLISYYVQHGLPVPMDAPEFQTGLRERFVERDGMFFTATQAAAYEEKRKHTDGLAPMGIIVSDEANGIEWLKNRLRESPKTYQQIHPDWMQAINGLRKGDILPELKTLLEENFIEMEDGKWRLPNIQDDVDKNLMRTKALLREFNLYKELALKPKAKLREVRVEALRAGFKQCYIDKDFQTIVTVGDKIPQNLRDEDEVLLQFYDIALNKL
jgi:16S rRNA G966 N2-methylase RsmD